MTVVTLKSGDGDNGEFYLESRLNRYDSKDAVQRHSVFYVRLIPWRYFGVGEEDRDPENVLFEFDDFSSAIFFFENMTAENAETRDQVFFGFGKKMSRSEAADYIGVEAQTLANWASTGKVKIPFLKVGRKVIYLKSDLDTYLENSKSQ